MTTPTPWEVRATCPACLVDGALIELLDPHDGASRFAMPSARRCVVCELEEVCNALGRMRNMRLRTLDLCGVASAEVEGAQLGRALAKVLANLPELRTLLCVAPTPACAIELSRAFGTG